MGALNEVLSLSQFYNKDRSQRLWLTKTDVQRLRSWHLSMWITRFDNAPRQTTNTWPILHCKTSLSVATAYRPADLFRPHVTSIIKPRYVGSETGGWSSRRRFGWAGLAVMQKHALWRVPVIILALVINPRASSKDLYKQLQISKFLAPLALFKGVERGYDIARNWFSLLFAGKDTKREDSTTVECCMVWGT